MNPRGMRTASPRPPARSVSRRADCDCVEGAGQSGRVTPSRSLDPVEWERSRPNGEVSSGNFLWHVYGKPRIMLSCTATWPEFLPSQRFSDCCSCTPRWVWLAISMTADAQWPSARNALFRARQPRARRGVTAERILAASAGARAGFSSWFHPRFHSSGITSPFPALS